MLEHKLFFASFMVLTGITTYCLPMFRQPTVVKQEDRKVIAAAAYFKIHGSSRCIKYCNNHQSIQSAHECTAFDLLAHDQGSLTMSYHDQNNTIIAIVDITAIKCSRDMLSQQGQIRLDPSIKPQAYKAVIRFNDETDRRIVLFYTQENHELLKLAYDGPAVIQDVKNIKTPLIDLSKLEIVEDYHENDGGCCIIF